MLTDFISSKTRVKLLLKFFLNPSTVSYLRGLSDEFQDSTNSVRLELNRLQDAGMLTSFKQGNKLMYQANPKYPLFDDIQNIVKKHLGIDEIIRNVVERLGNVERVYLTGPFALGHDGEIIDVLIVGDVDIDYLNNLVSKAEKMVGRKINYTHYDIEAWSESVLGAILGQTLLIWTKSVMT